MTVGKGDVSAEGQRLIVLWLKNRDAIASQHRVLKSLQEDRDSIARELSKWILPSGAKDGEKIGVWFGDSIITAMQTPNGATIEVRLLGRSITHGVTDG